MKNFLQMMLFASFILLTSCRSSDEMLPETPVKQDFFNLNVGNKWVYKTYENYDFTNPQVQYTFTGRIDSVSIVSKVNVKGLTFAKERIKINWINSNQNNVEQFRYLRVNSKGHLIYLKNIDNPDLNETSGTVLHPGEDLSYFYSYDFTEMNEIIGNLYYKLSSEKEINMNGTTYKVSPYVGVFTPSSSHPDLLKKTQEISYKKGIGLIKEICHSVHGKSYLETRLESSNIKE